MEKFDDPGHIHFVTFKTANNVPFFKDDKCCDIFLEELDRLRTELSFDIYGFVIVPDHVHLLIGQVFAYGSPNKFGDTPESSLNEFGISYIGKKIKGVTARKINKYLQRSGALWKHRFFDFNIYSHKKFEEKLKYIHDNPISHGLVSDISLFRYCSWRNYELGDHSVFKINVLAD
ncbi:MAG: hypothetical protein NTZ49_04580 [Candidatus Parcubacteria bacterium]|nr:hypothetical protein [Candidatus Parcubacteria bacterium]